MKITFAENIQRMAAVGTLAALATIFTPAASATQVTINLDGAYLQADGSIPYEPGHFTATLAHTRRNDI